MFIRDQQWGINFFGPLIFLWSQSRCSHTHYGHCRLLCPRAGTQLQDLVISVRCCRNDFSNFLLKCILKWSVLIGYLQLLVLLPFRKQSCCLKIFIPLLKPCFRCPFKIFLLFFFFQKVTSYRYGTTSQKEHLHLSSLIYCNVSYIFFFPTRNSLIHGCLQNKWPDIIQIQHRGPQCILVGNEGFLCED